MKNINTILFIIINSYCGLVNAATFCVSDSNMLELVLDITESNGQDDHIKIKSGNYVPADNFGFRFFIAENFDITISGGWDNGCNEQSFNSLDTTLDGENSKRVISFYSTQNTPTYTANIFVTDLSINNGFYEEQQNINSKSAGLAFEFSSNEGGHFIVDRVFFMGNRSNLSSSIRLAGAKVTIKNSIFFQNESDTGTIYSVADQFYLINNTMVNNTYYDQFNGGTSKTGLWITLFTEQVYVANNIFWDNYGPDIFASPMPTAYLYNNNYQSIDAVFDFSADNISEDPQLTLFAPALSSPVVDAGKSEPSGIIPFPPPFYLNWNHSDFDFLSGDRLVNNRVDIGAIEALSEVPIFKNGFERPRGG